MVSSTIFVVILEIPENNTKFSANVVSERSGFNPMSINFASLTETPDASFIQDVFEFNKFICLPVLEVILIYISMMKK